MIGYTETTVVGYLFKERQIFFDGPSRRQRKLSRAWRRTCDEGHSIFFHCRGATDPLANFFCATVHPRRTRVGRNTDRVDTAWVWVEGCDWTATLRYATFFSSLLSCRRRSSNRGRKERQKGERLDALLRRLGRPAGFSRVNARGRVKKKRGRASPPSGLILPRVHHVEKRTRPA